VAVLVQEVLVLEVAAELVQPEVTVELRQVMVVMVPLIQ